MAETKGSGNSFQGPVYRDPFRLASARVTSSTVINASTPYFAVQKGQGDIYVPGSDASTAIDSEPGIFTMGPGDRFEVFMGGSDAANETALALITKLDPVAGADGTPVAFIEREIARATFTFGSTALGASNPLSAAFTELLDADFISDTVALGAAADGVSIISPASEAPWASVLCQARQSMFMRVQAYVGTAAACWAFARRLQGDARPVVR